MKQITLTIPDEKYATFLELMNDVDYVHIEEDSFMVSEEQIKYVLDIKANTKRNEMIDSVELFQELDKKYV